MFKTLTYTEAQTKMHGPPDTREYEFEISQFKDTLEACSTFVRVCRREMCELTEEPTGNLDNHHSGWFGKKIWAGKWTITEEDDGTLTASCDGDAVDFPMELICKLGSEIGAGLHGCNSGLRDGSHNHGPCEHGVHGQ